MARAVGTGAAAPDRKRRSGRPLGTVGDRELVRIARDAQALMLRAQNMPWQDIALQLGFSDERSALRGAKRAAERVPAGSAQNVRAREIENLQMLEDEAWKVYNSDACVVSAGKVHEHLIDYQLKVQTLRLLLAISESTRRLVGADAPARKIIEVVTPDMIEEEVRRREAMIDQARAMAIDVEAWLTEPSEDDPPVEELPAGDDDDDDDD